MFSPHGADFSFCVHLPSGLSAQSPEGGGWGADSLWDLQWLAPQLVIDALDVWWDGWGEGEKEQMDRFWHCHFLKSVTFGQVTTTPNFLICKRSLG